MCAKTSPTRTWTRSLSTSFWSLVSATFGCPWLSSTITSTLRPAIVWLFSSSHIAIPFVMSLPIWAAPPDIGAITPILIGPFWAHAGPGPAIATRTADSTHRTITFLAMARSPFVHCLSAPTIPSGAYTMVPM